MSAQTSRKMRRFSQHGAAALFASAGTCAAMLAIATSAATAAPAKVRIGTPPPVPAGATAIATSARDISGAMQLTVALNVRHAAQLSAYAAAVGDPSSPDYRDYLTARQFRARYAPTRATILKIESDLRRAGLQVKGLTANHLGVRVAGSAGAVERAFSISFLRLRLANGRDVEVNAEAPAVAASIAGEVQSVVGLNGLETMTSTFDGRRGSFKNPLAQSAASQPVDHTHPSTGGPRPCSAALKAENGHNAVSRGAYTPDQVASYYDFGGLYHDADKGQGVTVAVYELEWNSGQDISTYQKCYGTHTKISYVLVDGGSGRYTSGKKKGKKKNPDGSGEAALDIEQIISYAPKARVLVYDGPNSNGDSPGDGPYDVFAKIIGQDRAAVVSSSWGECEPVETFSDAAAENTMFKEAVVQGQSITSSAGDDGSEDCDGQIAGGGIELAVDDPSSQPWITAVGGTSLDLSSSPKSEAVWNNDDDDSGDFEPGAGGGGLSSFWAMPDYQQNAAAGLGVINADSSAEPGCGPPSLLDPQSTYCREVPDVSANADPVYGYLTYYNGNKAVGGSPSGWQAVGGTSASSPLWAALFTLADASKSCHGSRVGFANPALYRLGGESQGTYFHDITTGNNDLTGAGEGLFPATSGYDMATGLGTPKAAALASGLCGAAIRVTGTGNRTARVGTSVHLQLHAKLPSGVSGKIAFHSSHLPAGLKLNSASGLITGKLTKAQTRDVVIAAHVDGESPANAYGALTFTWTVKARKQTR